MLKGNTLKLATNFSSASTDARKQKNIFKVLKKHTCLVAKTSMKKRWGKTKKRKSNICRKKSLPLTHSS